MQIRLNIALNWWNFLLFICLWKNWFCVHIYFLFSVQLIAAVYPFMSNHQCLYPHIPVPGSYSKPVTLCFMTALKLYLTSQCIFTVQADQQVCTALHPTFSLSVTFSYLPVWDAFIPLSQFLYCCFSLSLSLSLCLASQEASYVCANVLSWLLSHLALAAFAFSFLLCLFCSLSEFPTV